MEKLEFKGTKGEWFMDKLESYVNKFGVNVTTISVHKNPNIAYIVGVSEVFGDDEEAEANAKLIASAPDLLEALQELVNDGFQTPSNLNMNKAIKAIEKALK